MFNNASNVDASHSTFSEVHRDQYIYSKSHIQGNQTVNTVVHGNQILQGCLGLENLYRTSVPGAAFDSIDRHPAPVCLPGTRLELLVRLTEWIDNPDRDQPMCWLSGLAGSGKSAVAQSIAERYASQQRLAASFFFSRKEILRRKAHRFFPTLACQMLVFAPSIKPALLDVLDADATLPTKVLLEQARRLLQEPIASSATSFPQPVLIVVDSLDECDDVKMAEEVVYLLSRMLRHIHWPLKILFTGRSEPHIIRTFQRTELRSMTRLLQLQDFHVDDDIRAYLRYSFQGIQESTNTISNANDRLPWPSEGDLELVVQKAAGLFIFATTVVKYVGIRYGSPVTRLQGVIRVLRDGAGADSALIHSPLDALYFDTLHAIQDTEKVSSVLGLIVFAFRPLSTHGLSELLWESQFDATYVVKSLCSVLVISESDADVNGAVRIYHTSFRDFLTSRHRSEQYFVNSAHVHATFARACLELMIRHLATDMCGLGNPSILNSEIEDLGKRCSHCIKEGVRYACRWFAHHLSQVSWDQGMDNALILSLQGFARGYLLNWIEVLSLTGELDSAVFSLREAADWLKHASKPYEETLLLFRDAERLVLMCYDSIQRAALQVYYSLPYAPTQVQIRSLYAHELKHKFVITHGLDDHWKPCLRSVSTGSAVRSLSISSSGRLIASAGDAPGVQLWDTITGSNIGHFFGDGVSTCPVMFSPSGSYVTIGYDTGAIDIWDVTTGQKCLHSSQSLHNGSVMVLIFSQNNLVASGAADGSVHLWDTSTWTLRTSLACHRGPILCLSFSTSSSLIASGSEDTLITTSETRSGKTVRVYRGHSARVNSVSFSSDGGSLASGSDDESVRLWDTRTGVCLRTFSGMHKKPVRQVWITADNKYVVSVCSMDICMWETSSLSRKPAQHLWSVNHFFRKSASMFPAWYGRLARLAPLGLVAQYGETDDGTILHSVPSSDGYSMGIARGSCLVYLEHAPPRKSWSRIRHPLTASPTMDEPPLFLDDSDDHFDAIAMTVDTVLLATYSDDGNIKIWNTSPRGSWKNIQKSFKSTVTGFWPTPSGRSLLVKPMVGVQLFISDGTTKDLETGGDALGSVGAVPSPDSRYFAYWAEYAWNVDNSFSIHIYNASTGFRLKRIPGFFNITCARFSAESDLFACAHGGGIVQIWELPSVLCKTTVTTNYGAITALEFVPGNVTLVVGSDQGCVEIRLVENGDVMHRVEYSPSKVLALAVPRGALIVIVGHEDGSVFVWDPSYPNIAPHCLLPGVVPRLPSEDSSDGDSGSPVADGINFIKFIEDYRAICTRSSNGVICTWDLTSCLARYAEGAGIALPGDEGLAITGIETEEENTLSDFIMATSGTSVFSPANPCSEGSDGLNSSVMCHSRGEQIIVQEAEGALPECADCDTITTPLQSITQAPSPHDLRDADRSDGPLTDCTTAECDSSILHRDSESPIPQDTLSPGVAVNANFSGPTPEPPSCPHLVSRSDSHIFYDRYFRSTYSIDVQQGWVFRGSKRLFWLPGDLRPASPTGLAAFEDKFVILTRSGSIVFFDLRPMVDPMCDPVKQAVSR